MAGRKHVYVDRRRMLEKLQVVISRSGGGSRGKAKPVAPEALANLTRSLAWERELDRRLEEARVWLEANPLPAGAR